MDSISRFHISVREDGLWNVIDSRTGGPAMLEQDGMLVLLYGMSKEDAKAMSLWLNRACKSR